MECNFVVGQKVECVVAGLIKQSAGRAKFDPLPIEGLTKGQIYTIRAVDLDEFSGIPVVYLVEIIRKVSGPETKECGFYPSRFRPLITTDISVFKAMLAPRVKVDG